MDHAIEHADGDHIIRRSLRNQVRHDIGRFPSLSAQAVQALTRQYHEHPMSAFPLGECQQRCIGQLAGVQPFSERKAALSARQVERQRRLDDGSRRLEHRGGDSHAPIRRHELVALGDHFVHFGRGIAHLESSSSLAATPNFAAQSFR